jgi:hypothetical protein
MTHAVGTVTLSSCRPPKSPLLDPLGCHAEIRNVPGSRRIPDLERPGCALPDLHVYLIVLGEVFLDQMDY